MGVGRCGEAGAQRVRRVVAHEAGALGGALHGARNRAGMNALGPDVAAADHAKQRPGAMGGQLEPALDGADGTVIGAGFALLAAGEHALDVARDGELEAILQLLSNEGVQYEEQWAEKPDDANERIAAALRSVRSRLEDRQHRGVSADDTEQRQEREDESQHHRVPWRHFAPRATSARFNSHSELTADAVPIIRLDVSGRIPSRRHADYFINEVMARVERDLGRALIWRPIDNSTASFTRIHIEVCGLDRDGHDIGAEQKSLERIWLKCHRELLREHVRTMLDPLASQGADHGAR
jgi:hypothetical protein